MRKFCFFFSKVAAEVCLFSLMYDGAFLTSKYLLQTTLVSLIPRLELC